jgi:hypothetical protein
LAEIVLPCLTTVAAPLTFSTTATMGEVSAKIASPVIDNKNKAVAKAKNILFKLKLLCFILGTLQSFFIPICRFARIKPQYQIEGAQ